MELIFVRHGEPDWTGDESTLDDPPLTSRGHRQAELAAERIAAGPEIPTDLVVSPALRSQETARPIATRTGLAIDTVDSLLELGMPSRAGLTEKEGQHLQDDSFNRPPSQWWDGLDGGETFADFHTRVTDALASDPTPTTNACGRSTTPTSVSSSSPTAVPTPSRSDR